MPGRGSFRRPRLGWKRWARARFSWARAQYVCSVSANCAGAWNFWYVQHDCVNISERNKLWEGRVLPRPKRLKIINHKVNKTMHSTVLSESASLLSSRAIGNFLFPTYEVMIMSMLHSFLLKITVNSGLWMLMLSLNNFIGNIHVSAPAVLGPPQNLSVVETRDDTHPKPVLINISPLLWPMVCLYVNSGPVSNGLS